ncbi:hypothetical protein CMI37_27570 [Candidatus Pacearchaeota archaeon]|jgi:hypothetical protein|nr:hypothetical protein [Candidatus Pacearchaeota archaeon]|tara:strand:+ start:322 stop:603 length:282 start_codon:yes stop_codon:yes gene_type:complete
MLLLDAAAPAVGAAETVHNRRGLDKIAVSATAGTTSTVIIQGSHGKDAAGVDLGWIDLVTLTDTSGDSVAWFPLMRANATAVGSTVSVHLSGN